MKYIFLLLFFVIFCNLSLNAQQDNYIYINNGNFYEHSSGNSITSSGNNYFFWLFYQTPTTYQITDVQFFGSYKWATHTDMGLVYTMNGGTNWNSVSFKDTTFNTLYNGVYFINNQTGWAVGGALQIRKTTNGGLNWIRQIPPPIAGVLNSVKFLSANTGFAIGRQGANWKSCILKTTDGGNYWYEIVASTANENELFGQLWSDANTGWICGKSFLMKTTNGGLNFTDYYANIPPTSNGVNALLCISFSQFAIWIGGSNLDHKNLYKSTNGGLNWAFQNNPVSQYTYPQINDIKFSYPFGFAAHGTPSSGAIMITSDNGNTWTVDNGTNTWFDCLSTYNDYLVHCGAGEGKIWYTTIPSGVKTISKNVPEKFLLYQNYPNPFNPTTNIKFDVPSVRQASLLVTLKVYDIMGKEVQTLVNESLKPGTYEATFDGSMLNSGVYFYRIQAGDYSETKKMLMIK